MMLEEIALRFVVSEPPYSLPSAHDTVKVIDQRSDTAWYVHIRRVLSETAMSDGTIVLKVLASRERCGSDCDAK